MLVPLALAACDRPRATADRVSSNAQLVGGPKTLGEIGDYVLENDQIRVVIHGPGPGRGSTIFGGSILDADLQRPEGNAGRGNDQLGEVLPSFLMQVLDPVSITVTASGAEGGPAVIAVEGEAGDLLQQVAILNQGLLFPSSLLFREEYRLHPGARHIEIVTSITNRSTIPHPLPYLQPAELRNLGLDIPGLEDLDLSVPLGHLLLFGGENEIFASGEVGFNLRFAIEDSYDIAQGFPAFPGLVTNLLATRGRGVSYGLAVPSSADNYPSSYRSFYEPQPVTGHSLLVPYVYSAVTGVYHTKPPDVILPGQTFSYTAWFVIGRGDVASITDEVYKLRGEATGRLAGFVLDEQTLAPLERASLMVRDDSGWVTQADSDARGAFRLDLPAGTYQVQLVTPSRPVSDPETVVVENGRTTSRRFLLPPPGRLAVQVLDELGRPVPCKVQLVGRFDAARRGQDPRSFLYDLRLGERYRPTTLDPERTEFIENSWYVAHGLLTAEVKPGEYDLVVSRGVEYHLQTIPIVVSPGAFVSRSVQLQRAFATPGYIAADLHLHAANSVDSGVTLEDRVVSVAAEGIEMAAATDHNFLTDYRPAIGRMGLERWLAAVVGMELTTFEMGHFNGYPLVIQPGSARGGDFLWPGKTPDELFDELRRLGDDVLIEVNHPRDGVVGYFSQFNVDSETGDAEPRLGLRAVLSPFEPEFAPERFSYDFDVIEVLNGKRFELIHTYRAPDPLPPPPLPDPPPAPGDIVRLDTGQVAFPGQVEDWFTLLSRGHTATGVGNSDAHGLLGDEPGYARTWIWVGDGQDEPGQLRDADLVAGLRSHRAIMSNAPFLTMTVDGQPLGSLVRASANATVVVEVKSANFAPVDRLLVYLNGEVVVDRPIPAAEAHDHRVEVSLPIARDAWMVAEVQGSANLFPVVPPQEFEPLSVDGVLAAVGRGLDLSEALEPTGNLRPARTFAVKPLALTNPIWLDRDGNGRFDPPLPPLPVSFKGPRSKVSGDVRAAFRSLPEVSP